MAKIKVGILVDSYYLPTSGGGYSYYTTLLKKINAYSWHDDIEIVNILFAESQDREVLLKKSVVVPKKYIYSARYVFYKVLHTIAYRLGKTRFRKTWLHAMNSIAALRDRHTEKVLEQHGIDLVYYLKPEESSLNYPFITTHWDVGHRSMPAFPETTLNGHYETRERYYTTILNKALLVICESHSGAAELLRYYTLNPAKVKVMPLFSGDVARMNVNASRQQEILAEYGLQPQQFFVYPAQFWAHKNHYNLVTAFRALCREARHSSLKLVLCGSDKGNLAYIRQVVADAGLQQSVLMPGFVRDEALHVLYRHALALVMPTFLGPTNIPLLEAAELGCPVICSDLAGHREMMGEGALYFDPADACALQRQMEALALDSGLRNSLLAAAARQTATSPFSIEKSVRVLEQILLGVIPVRRSWGISRYVIPVLACSLLAA